jgi:CTP:molybdopterin cytidylyltransferase MocA
MKVIVPLAGKGTRLLPLTNRVPKPLVHVAGRPVMDYVMDSLRGLDVDELIVITGHLKDVVERYIVERYDVKARFVEQKKLDGTAGAINLARPFVDRPVLIIFVDTLFEADMSIVKTVDADGIIWVKEVEDYQRFGVIVTDARGYIEVDEGLQTSVRGIWAIGDVNGRGAFTHTSYNDYEIVAANLLDGGQRQVSDRIPTYALFIDPPLGRVGMTEREVRASGRRALKARRMMTRVGRARERSETQGFMQVLVDAETKKILGAAVLGIEGDEAVHCILDLMAADAPYTVLQRAMHIHPTVSELLPTLLGDLQPLE